MKIKMTYLILLFTLTTSMGQNNYLRMVKNHNGKIRVFNEGKRVKIKTLKGEKYIGLLSIVNNTTISIKNTELQLDEIRYVRNRSRGSGFAGTFITAYGGLLILASPSLGIHGDTKGPIILASVGSLVALAGIFSHEVFPKNKKAKWAYSIITNQE